MPQTVPNRAALVEGEALRESVATEEIPKNDFLARTFRACATAGNHRQTIELRWIESLRTGGAGHLKNAGRLESAVGNNRFRGRNMNLCYGLAERPTQQSGRGCWAGILIGDTDMSIPVTTTFNIEGYRIVRYLGVVRGIIVRAPTITQGILGGLKSIIGGNIGAYTEMCETARQQAYELLIDHATALGANAIMGLRYDASEIGGKMSATEVLCYGTAVVIEPEAAG